MNSDTLLTRRETAQALTAAGFQVSMYTIETKAVRGGGPPYQRFARRVMYRWGDAGAWAKAIPTTATSTAEHKTMAAANNAVNTAITAKGKRTATGKRAR